MLRMLVTVTVTAQDVMAQAQAVNVTAQAQAVVQAVQSLLPVSLVPVVELVQVVQNLVQALLLGLQ